MLATADEQVARRYAGAKTRTTVEQNLVLRWVRMSDVRALYQELEEISGQSCSLHLTGGVMMAGTPERMDYLRLAHDYHTILIDRIPVMDFADRNAAKRFI